MRWNDHPDLKAAREICHKINLEKELNNEELLQEILKQTLLEAGIMNGQCMAIDLLAVKQGDVILSYAQNGKINEGKILKLVREHTTEAGKLLAYTAICLMEEYGIIRGGPKFP